MDSLNPITIARFWSKVDVSRWDGPCWEWRGGTDGSGYGQFKVDGRDRRAHRVAFCLVNGAVPDDVPVLHACDNARCCNPAHLSAGTLSENQKAMVARHRRRSRLTDDLRQEIAEAEGTRTEIAARFGVSPRTVTNAKVKLRARRRGTERATGVAPATSTLGG